MNRSAQLHRLNERADTIAIKARVDFACIDRIEQEAREFNGSLCHPDDPSQARMYV